MSTKSPRVDELRLKQNVGRMGCTDVFDAAQEFETSLTDIKIKLDKLWIDLYGGEPAASVEVALKRMVMIADDVRCQSANFRAANKAYIELDQKLRCLTRSSER